MLGAREGGLGRRAVADQRIDADVRAVVLVQQRRAGLGGIRCKGHARQRLVVDRDLLGALLGRGDRLGDHDGQRLADEARLVVRQREKSGAVNAGEPSVLISGISAGCHEKVLIGGGPSARPRASPAR